MPNKISPPPVRPPIQSATKTFNSALANTWQARKQQLLAAPGIGHGPALLHSKLRQGRQERVEGHAEQRHLQGQHQQLGWGEEEWNAGEETSGRPLRYLTMQQSHSACPIVLGLLHCNPRPRGGCAFQCTARHCVTSVQSHIMLPHLHLLQGVLELRDATWPEQVAPKAEVDVVAPCCAYPEVHRRAHHKVAEPALRKKGRGSAAAVLI